ncbi:MAG: response regulator [Planctomycetaceae bacterium]|nr:response regulator [Planctomycetaceae bacterium]
MNAAKTPVVLQADRKLGETRALRTELRRRGARVLMAETAEQALEAVRDVRPDVLLLDDDLCASVSPDLLEQFSERFPDAEVILLCSRHESVTRGVGRGLLFQGQRPVSSETLLELVADALPGRLKEAPRKEAAPPMVLCVDDDAQTLSALSRLLQRHGYRVSTVQDAREALSKISSIGPDMAIIDVAMPDVNGCELARKIREQYRGLFPIVMHSAKASDADRWSGFRHGADYYLPKPSEPHQILDVVDYYADRLDGEERQYLESRL